jgi:hypothetical protein
MGGGGWALPFQDNVDNRDRVFWAGKFGNITTFLLPIEKLAEGDGGNPSRVPANAPFGRTVQAPLTNSPAANDAFDQSQSDLDAYAAGIIWPIAPWLVWKPLLYYVDFQNGLGSPQTIPGTPDNPNPNGATDIVFLNGLTVKFWQLKLDAEITWRNRQQDQYALNTNTGRLEDWDETQFTWFGDLSWASGPFEAAIGGWYLQGTDSHNAWKNAGLNGTDGEFQPYLLLFSEDMGLLFDTAGVPNGSAGLSGYQSFFVRGSYKLTDTMKVGAIFGMLKADETINGPRNAAGIPQVANGTKTNGLAADDDLGWELDFSFAWGFMPNIKYVAELAYFSPGDYFKDIHLNVNGVGTDFVDAETSTWGIRHMLVINW